MARLTIEDCWWTDPRRERLGDFLGALTLADSAAIRMWRLAQEFWGRGRKLVPTEIFETLEAAPKLIEAKLAIVQADGVYVKGSSQYIDWLNEKREAGKRGGQKSASRPRDAKGRLQKTSKQNPSSVQTESKQIQPSGFGSGSDSKIQHFSAKNGETALQLAESTSISLEEVKNPVAIWCNEYSREYGVRYEIQKKDAGMLVNFAKGRSTEKIQTLFACYFAIKEPLYENQKHPLSLFFRDIAKISVAAQTGVDPSKKKTAIDKWLEDQEENEGGVA